MSGIFLSIQNLHEEWMHFITIKDMCEYSLEMCAFFSAHTWSNNNVQNVFKIWYKIKEICPINTDENIKTHTCQLPT